MVVTSATVMQGGMVVSEVKSQGWMEVRGVPVLLFLQLSKESKSACARHVSRKGVEQTHHPSIEGE